MIVGYTVISAGHPEHWNVLANHHVEGEDNWSEFVAECSDKPTALLVAQLLIDHELAKEKK